MRKLLATLTLAWFGGVAWAQEDTKEVDSHFGTWRQVAVVADGKEIEVGPSTLLAVTREGYTVTVEGKPYQKGTTKVEGAGSPGKAGSPVKSDVTVTEGELAGQTLKQISKIEGDVLIACIGVERPTAFTSKPGSGHTLSVWIRVP